jgi:hypothetical protein
VDEARAPLIGLLAGVAMAGSGLILAAATGAPYLTAEAVNGWIVVFAVGVLVCLSAMPFAIERRMRAGVAERDRRWERALLAWGAIAVAILLAGFLLGISAGWSGSSLAGATGLLITIEAALVVATLVVLLLSG